jgi:nucleoside-diphosphate-sugar epimerase
LFIDEMEARIKRISAIVAPGAHSDGFSLIAPYRNLQSSSDCNDTASDSLDVRGSNSSRLGDTPRQRQPDIAKARQVLGWTPRTPLKEGLMRTIAHFENLLQEDGVRAVGGEK